MSMCAPCRTRTILDLGNQTNSARRKRRRGRTPMHVKNVGARARPTREEQALRRLIRERGLERYGLFFGTGEGSFLPDGTEAGSGYVVDERGRVFFWWTGWDAERRTAT